MASPYGRTRSRAHRWSAVSLVAIAAGVILGVTIAGVNAYLASRPCTPAGLPTSPGSPMCPVAPPPTPTTFLAAGTAFSIPAAQSESFEIQPSAASLAVLNGSFLASAGAVILVMTPGAFANYSQSPSTFPCGGTGLCFATGNRSAGEVGFTIPLYAEPDGGPAAAPWYLVMQNPNVVSVTRVTWTTNLVATYIDVSL